MTHRWLSPEGQEEPCYQSPAQVKGVTAELQSVVRVRCSGGVTDEVVVP